MTLCSKKRNENYLTSKRFCHGLWFGHLFCFFLLRHKVNWTIKIILSDMKSTTDARTIFFDHLVMLLSDKIDFSYAGQMSKWKSSEFCRSHWLQKMFKFFIISTLLFLNFTLIKMNHFSNEVSFWRLVGILHRDV